MAHIIILGTANALPDAQHENSHMVVVQGERAVLVDCAGSTFLRLQQAGVELDSLSDIILTHFHPDHAAGMPLLLMDLWLLGRKRAITIHGLAHTLERFEKMMGLYDWQAWPGFYPVNLRKAPNEEGAALIEEDDFRVLSSPVKHLLPTIGLRFEFIESKKSVAYSCDTEPCEAVARLAAGVNALIHEAAGATVGHSSAAQAAQIARQAETRRLFFIHYPTATHGGSSEKMLEEARREFQGEVSLLQDFQRLEIAEL